MLDDEIVWVSHLCNIKRKNANETIEWSIAIKFQIMWTWLLTRLFYLINETMNRHESRIESIIVNISHHNIVKSRHKLKSIWIGVVHWTLCCVGTILFSRNSFRQADFSWFVANVDIDSGAACCCCCCAILFHYNIVFLCFTSFWYVHFHNESLLCITIF